MQRLACQVFQMHDCVGRILDCCQWWASFLLISIDCLTCASWSFASERSASFVLWILRMVAIFQGYKLSTIVIIARLGAHSTTDRFSNCSCRVYPHSCRSPKIISYHSFSGPKQRQLGCGQGPTGIVKMKKKDEICFLVSLPASIAHAQRSCSRLLLENASGHNLVGHNLLRTDCMQVSGMPREPTSKTR